MKYWLIIHQLEFKYNLNIITFKIKTGISNLKQWNNLEEIKKKITKDKIGINVFYLEISKVVSVHCNLVNNSHQQNLRALYTFFPNRWFVQLLEIS